MPAAQDVLAAASWTLHRVDPSAGAGAPHGAAAPPGEDVLSGGAVESREDGSTAWAAVLAQGVPARVPGTVTGALRDALGEQTADQVLRTSAPDAVWEYRTSLTTAGGPHRVTSTGVATVARLLVAGEEVHASDTAFLPWDVTVDLPSGRCDITLRLLPLSAVPVPRKPRARWLSPLVSDRSMRWRRTPLLGSIDWPGARPVIGPWGGLSARPVRVPDAVRPGSGADAALPGSVREAAAPRASAAATPVAAGPAKQSRPATSDSAGDVSSPPVHPDASRELPAEPFAVRTLVDEQGDGVVGVRCAVDDLLRGRDASPVRVEVAAVGDTSGAPVSCEQVVTAADADGAGCVTLQLSVPRPDLWWPHGMGRQTRYTVRVRAAGAEHAATVGFRTLEAEPRDAEHRGLALRINRIPLFVRGAVWTGVDPSEVAASPERVRAVLTRLRDAGTTMVRIPGTGCYEGADFHRACDELGILVWQDVALGPLDPPDEPQWRAGLRAEVRALASRLAAHPSTAVLSGGTEVIQAPVLAGRPAEQWTPPVLVRDIPEAVGKSGADVVVVPSSPCSDADLNAARDAQEASRQRAHRLWFPSPTAAGGREDGPASSSVRPACSPVDAADGVSHYFGVGAYGRPIEDAVTRGVRFAAESLAFAVPPEPAVVRAQFGTDAPLDGTGSAHAWRQGVAHDPGAGWTFEDTTQLYVHRLFLDRDSDPDAGLASPARPAPQDAPADHSARLELERAALAHVFQRTFAQWRAATSACRGALVLSAMSTAPGAGWGVLDVTGRPTAAWYGMRRACAPVALCFVPAGGDGLPLHVFNDAAHPLTATVRLTVATVRGGCQAPLEIPVEVPAHGELTLRADLADGTFRDLDHAYGFGEREYEAVSAVLLDDAGRVLARDTHLSGGPRRDAPSDPGLTARWESAGNGAWSVVVTATGLARFVALDLPVPGACPDGEAVAEDGYVHVLPGETVHLSVSGAVTGAVRRGTRVRALGAATVTVQGG
ncbi:glycoside hydrolase family 2 protein [Kocuria rhizophila]